MQKNRCQMEAVKLAEYNDDTTFLCLPVKKVDVILKYSPFGFVSVLVTSVITFRREATKQTIVEKKDKKKRHRCKCGVRRGHRNRKKKQLYSTDGGW